MDMVLAIVVLGAVIFFGALISAGNERQRKALDGIREQAAQWAMQDLRLKRESLAREVKVEDPVAWLNQVVAKVVGENLELVVTETFDDPQAVVCTTARGKQVTFSPISPDEVGRFKKRHGNRLSGKDIGHPLWQLPPKSEALELSILNAGILFDLEMPLAWKALKGHLPDFIEKLWLYRL